MFAAGVYDYNEALGVTVFGNACGELAVFNLSALRIAPLEECFEALPIPDGDGRHGFEVMSETTIPATFGLPFPYLGPLVPPREYAELLFAQWRARHPDSIPRGWERDADDGTSRAFPLDWTNLTPRIPRDIHDIGWSIAHAHHCIGPLVPLMKIYRYSLYTAGDLLLLYDFEMQQLWIVPPDLTLEQFLATCRAKGISRVPMILRNCDYAVVAWGKDSRRMWAWEGKRLGRNRWQELQDRGGDVHRDWLVPS
ncbi:uncharacterized protein PHACADRAFT_256018 [Phanerochaete carnosa HHB-10118-sp]|uniref:Uncharacterized protein n=1 Tax=Phanerochaete carnosa (strain HHB-10118-sp) TaxID=650164 RepID=K5VV66_PHACS|nr:uncharacterized protein PHACADRAFT_256018 [Phanerochaete carnosa HHB-10118-sp]EKM55408.1 hypothetical protein PHACADRAFT_256018 [Phanerochaete carnosa HHB-10118-sp]